MTPDVQSDHDLLLTASGKLDTILDRLDDHAKRLDRLESWRAAHAESSAVLAGRVDAIATGGSSHDRDIDELELWRAEMRGAWTTLRVEMAILAGLSGLSALLEVLRIAGVLR